MKVDYVVQSVGSTTLHVDVLPEGSRIPRRYELTYEQTVFHNISYYDLLLMRISMSYSIPTNEIELIGNFPGFQ